MKYLLDTSVFRELGKSVPHEHVHAWLASVDDADLAISALTVREVAKGIAKLTASRPVAATQIRIRTDAVFEAFVGRILAIDQTVAREWGEALAETGKHVDDAGFAATARIYDLILVTRNIRDVVRRKISILNPYKLPPQRSL
jgi:predicted nucleic acid-binding protein